MAELPQRLAAVLADRYRIERELGEGGMATVYLAQDVRHERLVALKVVRPEIAAALGPERFLREIKITAGLSHPHILPLLDSGEAHGHLFYVMPFVDGESLRDRLAREKQLPLEEALQLAREVADALSFAHARGVIHRDIKPENILLQAGHAVVADFGIARAIDAAGGGHLTETGLAVGTPAYMSPEQASGSADLDGRSDLYSLGCVLYEMLAGQPPFTGPTAESMVHQHLSVDAPSITRIRPAVPAAVAEVLARALAKTPADRFNPVAQFSESLRMAAAPGAVATGPRSPTASRHKRAALVALALVAAAAIVATGVLLTRATPDSAPAAAEATPSVAVLPFADLGAGGSEYLGDGIAACRGSRARGGALERAEPASHRAGHRKLRGLQRLPRGAVLLEQADRRRSRARCRSVRGGTRRRLQLRSGLGGPPRTFSTCRRSMTSG